MQPLPGGGVKGLVALRQTSPNIPLRPYRPRGRTTGNMFVILRIRQIRFALLAREEYSEYIVMPSLNQWCCYTGTTPTP